MAKQLMFDEEARLKIRDGVAKLARAVKVTMGPVGRNVILDKSFGKPLATKDGVTVSKEIELPDPFENMGAKLVNEVATKTNSAVGDGTTTATVLAEAIYTQGLKALNSGGNPTALRRGIELAVDAAVEAIRGQSREVAGREDVYKVAFISSREAEVAEVVADAFEKVGKDGVITIEEGRGLETEVKIVDGFQFDKGYVSPYFVTKPEGMVCEYEDAMILLYEKKISNLRDFLPALEIAARGGRPLLIIAEDLEGEALAALVVNRLRGILKAVAVKAPGFGERRKATLQDMAVLTGATVISEETGLSLENVTPEHFGSAKKVVVEKEATTIIEGAGTAEAIKARQAQIGELTEQATSNYDRDKLKERLAKLQGGVAQIDVGGATEYDMKERKARVDDAVNSGRAALAEGVIPGGGLAYIRSLGAIEALELTGDEGEGAKIVARALEAPLRQIASNAGAHGGVTVAEVKESEGAFGFDAKQGTFCDLWEAGVIDPTKVTRVALEKAASIAGLMLTTETMVTDREADTDLMVGAIG